LEIPNFSLTISNERRKQPEVGTDVGKEFKKDPTQIWPYLCVIRVGGRSKFYESIPPKIYGNRGMIKSHIKETHMKALEKRLKKEQKEHMPEPYLPYDSCRSSTR